MATKLKDFDFTHQSKLTPSGGKDSYPWDDWFDGDIWQITYGEDFDSHPLMMERIIRTRIVGREGKVTLRHVGVGDEPWGIIVLRRSDIEGPNMRKRRETTENRTAARAAKKATAAEIEPPKTIDKPVVKKAPTVKRVAPTNGTAHTNGTATKRTPTKRLASAAR
jgi:hypothetical protein